MHILAPANYTAHFTAWRIYFHFSDICKSQIRRPGCGRLPSKSSVTGGCTDDSPSCPSSIGGSGAGFPSAVQRWCSLRLPLICLAVIWCQWADALETSPPPLAVTQSSALSRRGRAVASAATLLAPAGTSRGQTLEERQRFR